MNLENHKETIKLTVAGIATIIIAGITLHSYVPDNQTGKILKFTIPLSIGMIFGAKIYLEKLEEVKRKIND